LIFRWDRDCGYAPTVYSLPYSKFKIFIAKSTAFLTLSLILYFFPYVLVIIPSNADILHVVSLILSSRKVLSGLTLALYAVLYTASVTALLGSFLRGLFPTLIGAFFVLSLSSSLFPSSLPPFSFLMYTAYSNVSPFEARFAVPGLVLPFLFFLIGALIFERRDVV
jgi:ABC-2 type transport system permease protein